MQDLNLSKLDAWITTDPRDRPIPSSIEDYLGQRVVVGQNQYGLGRWGTIVSFEDWSDWDEDRGQYGGTDFIVEFSDDELPRSDYISMTQVESQLRKVST